MKYSYSLKCALLVSTSDRYEDAWYPLFELIKKFWRNHPNTIVLNGETKGYRDNELNIKSMFSSREIPWSKRLKNCLERIEEEYIIFSLEDAFLLDVVCDDEIEKCLNWMIAYPEIAVCRLKSSSHPLLVSDKRFDTFCLAGGDVGYRLETQVSLWRKEDLINFIDETESPWEFEEKGTIRVKNTEKIFLWHCISNEADISQMIYPYHIDQRLGFGIAWGKWLWNNNKWFQQNGIYGVNYKRLGSLSEKAVKMRFRYLYRVGEPPAKGIEKIILLCYQMVIRIDQVKKTIRFDGYRVTSKMIKEYLLRKLSKRNS